MADLFPNENPVIYVVDTWEERTKTTTIWLPYESALVLATIRSNPVAINVDPSINVSTRPWQSVSVGLHAEGEMEDPPPITVTIDGEELRAESRDERTAIVPFFHAVAKLAS